MSSGLDYTDMTNLMFTRHYDLFEEEVKKVDASKLNYSAVSLLHFFVVWGYKDVLDRVCNKDAALRFDDLDWCREAEMKLCGRPVMPLLVAACKRFA
jgi:hypothetical protein